MVLQEGVPVREEKAAGKSGPWENLVERLRKAELKNESC
jgi:hypothetical protein